MNTDRIEKQIVLRAPMERVWQAISDSRQFGFWFGVAFDAPFTPGTHMIGRIAPTKVDPDVARLQAPYEGKKFEFWVERVEPMRSISFRWHPYAIDAGADYTDEPTTLIVFALRPVGNDTELTVTESGFERIPLQRRADAFKANDGGWSHQITNIEKYLAMKAVS